MRSFAAAVFWANLSLVLSMAMVSRGAHAAAGESLVSRSNGGAKWTSPGDVIEAPCVKRTGLGSIFRNCSIVLPELREQARARAVALLAQHVSAADSICDAAGEFELNSCRKKCDKPCRPFYSFVEGRDRFSLDTCTCRRERSWLRGAWVRNVSVQWSRVDQQMADNSLESVKYEDTRAPCEGLIADYRKLVKYVSESPVLKRNAELALASLSDERCKRNDISGDALAACHLLAARKAIEALYVSIAGCSQYYYAMVEYEHFFLRGRTVAGQAVAIHGALTADMNRRCGMPLRQPQGSLAAPILNESFRSCYERNVGDFFKRYILDAGGTEAPWKGEPALLQGRAPNAEGGSDVDVR